MSLLKKVIALAVKPQPLPPMLIDELELRVEPLAVKAVRNHLTGTAEVLIQWKDLHNFEAARESVDVMKQQFPAFHLEDKVALLGGVLLGYRLRKCMKEGQMTSIRGSQSSSQNLD